MIYGFAVEYGAPIGSELAEAILAKGSVTCELLGELSPELGAMMVGSAVPRLFAPYLM